MPYVLFLPTALRQGMLKLTPIRIPVTVPSTTAAPFPNFLLPAPTHSSNRSSHSHSTRHVCKSKKHIAHVSEICINTPRHHRKWHPHPANGAGYCHRQAGRPSLRQITPRSAPPRCGLKHPPKNDFIFNINCSNRVTMAATTTLGIGRDALLDTPQPAAASPATTTTRAGHRRMWQMNL